MFIYTVKLPYSMTSKNCRNKTGDARQRSRKNMTKRKLTREQIDATIKNHAEWLAKLQPKSSSEILREMVEKERKEDEN